MLTLRWLRRDSYDQLMSLVYLQVPVIFFFLMSHHIFGGFAWWGQSRRGDTDLEIDNTNNSVVSKLNGNHSF